MKFRPHFIFPISVLLALTLLSTCKKDCNEESEGCEYEQGFEMVKDWMYFKTGSYWIYQEENSGAIDTITVWEDHEGLDQEGNDAFLCFTESSYDGYSYRYNQSFSIHCLTEPDCQCEKVDRSKSRPGDFVGSGRMFVFPPILGNYTGSSGLSEVSELIEEYTLSDNSTTEAAVFHTVHNDSEGGQETYISIAKHIGIVRRELVEDELVWNLIEYDVMQ